MQRLLAAHNYNVITVSSVDEAIAIHATPHCVLAVLPPAPDILSDVCHDLRQWTRSPVVVLSNVPPEGKADVLDAGADDVVSPAVDVTELLARVRAHLRHLSGRRPRKLNYVFDRLEVDVVRRRVTVDNREVHLSGKEFDLLGVLVQNAGHMLTHDDLIGELWQGRRSRHLPMLRVYIGKLRQKLERDPENPTHILTEAGQGYRFR